jgi:hypothetical protein
MKFDAKQVDFIVGLVNTYSAIPVPKEFLIQEHGIETYLSEKDEAFRDVFPYMDKYVDKDGGSVNAIYNPFENFKKEKAIKDYFISNKKWNLYDALLCDEFDNDDIHYLGNHYLILDMTSGNLRYEFIKEADFNVKYTKAVAKLV